MTRALTMVVLLALATCNGSKKPPLHWERWEAASTAYCNEAHRTTEWALFEVDDMLLNVAIGRERGRLTRRCEQISLGFEKLVEKLEGLRRIAYVLREGDPESAVMPEQIDLDVLTEVRLSLNYCQDQDADGPATRALLELKRAIAASPRLVFKSCESFWDPWSRY